MGSKSPVAQWTETSYGLSMTVKKPSLQYLDEFFRLRCAPDLLVWGIYPNAKEVTESAAAYEAARKHLRFRYALNDPEVTVLVVGDGRTPRTGAMFAVRSAWFVVSVDPNMRPGDYSKIRRLNVFPETIEDHLRVHGVHYQNKEKLIVVAVHSHAKLPTTLPNASVIAMPCCVSQRLDRPPDVEYADWSCHSPQRTIRIWKNRGVTP